MNGVKATLHSVSANCYYVEISDIQAKDLATVYDVQIGDCSFKVSALSYANLIVQSASDENLVNLMKNVYLYYKSAAAYFE